MLTNVLLIVGHALGRMAAPYGFAADTPALMALARAGLVFRNAFAVSSHPSPARAALMTGRMPRASGMVGMPQRGFALHDPSTHIARVLRDAGYDTALAGAQLEARDGQAETLGYAEALVKPSRQNDAVRDAEAARAAAAYIQSRAGQTRPFFLSVGFWAARREFPNPARDIDAAYVQPPPGLPDTPAIRKDMTGYMTAVRDMDAHIGGVLDALLAAGLWDDTLIVFTSDTGPAFPGMRGAMTDAGLGVALIISAGGRNQGLAAEAIVTHQDVHATMLEAARLATSEGGGASLLPLLRGERTGVRDEAAAENNWWYAYEPARSVRIARYRLTRYMDYDTAYVPPNIDRGAAKTLWMERGFVTRPRPREELHDLDFDPHGRVNVMEQAAYADIHRTLSQRLDRYMRESGDPYYARIPRIEGFKADARYGTHPDGGVYEP